jgi:hypothetical protein
MRWALLFLTLITASCQSYKADMRTVCESEKLSMVDTTGRADDPTLRFRFIADWLDNNVQTPEAHALLADIRPDNVLMRDKAKKVRAAATQAGYDQCAFADWLAAH